MLNENEMRREIQSDFYTFYRYVGGVEQKTNWWVKEFCDFLQYKVYWSFLNGKMPVATIEAPVQHGKSRIMRHFLCWLVGLHPDLRFNYYTASDKLLNETSMAVRFILQSERYQAVFGARTGWSHENVETLVISADGKKFGQVDFRLMGAGNIGHPSHVSIIDDPYRNKEEAYSPTMREKILGRYREDIISRRQTPSMVIVIHSRWHVDDLIGQLKKKGGVLSFSYPAVLPNGKALFPELRPLPFLKEQKEQIGPFGWASLYQQSPVIAGGNVLKEEWFRTYSELPATPSRVVIVADTAQKTGQGNDYTVFQAWGDVFGNAYLLEQVRGKFEAPELLATARAFFEKIRATYGTVGAFCIEDKVSGTGLIQQLIRENLPIIPMQRQKDKFSRVLDVVPFIAAGKVFIPEQGMGELIEECIAFRQDMKHPHDDQVDCLTDGINEILNNAGPSIVF
ncbi:phage terminase large subunit [Candidatus Saccharibacteria bacterium]|nr:phage terminase large subunit [Candidatus Saccharibacteria bacterium]